MLLLVNLVLSFQCRAALFVVLRERFGLTKAGKGAPPITEFPQGIAGMHPDPKVLREPTVVFLDLGQRLLAPPSLG